MASEIIVNTIKAPTTGANANKVIIPSGVTLDANAGDFRPPAGSVIQTVQTSTNTTSAISGTTYVGVGLDVNITPKYSNSKILVTVCGSFGNTQDTYGGARLYRGSTEIGGTANVNNRNGYAFPINERSVDAPWEAFMASYTYLDSPATTSQITYSLKIAKHYGTAITVNRAYNDNDAAYGWRSVSTITVQEIAQ